MLFCEIKNVRHTLEEVINYFELAATNRTIRVNGNAIVVFLNLTKAFDSVNHL